MAVIMLGPAGSPASSTMEGIGKVKELGLQCMEVQFSHGVHMKLELAKQIGEEARKQGISLSIHAPYYVNLASVEEEKRKASMKRILDSCERGHLMGAKDIVFHAAFYGKLSPERVQGIVTDAVKDMQAQIERRGWDVRLSPETTGKVSQWGTLEEVLGLAKETGCSFCVDFAHLYARNRGNIDYDKELDMIQGAGHQGMHIHFSNINYGLKGERSHKVLDGSPPFEPLARGILDRDMDATIISESPITWKDSLKMKEVFEKLGHRF